MKIVCQNCNATYKIADDKVQGKKVFKLKCKKCSADILVRGTDADAPAPAPASETQERQDENEATRAMDASGYGGGAEFPGVGAEGIWHAVINGDNQGPFTVEQLRNFLVDGSIDAGTYVWREGFDGWQPMNEVVELETLLSLSHSLDQAPASADIFTAAPAAFSAPPSAAPPSAAIESNGMFAVAEQRVPRSSPDAAPKARANTKGGDLFAAEVRAEESQRPATQESRPASGEAATGQRNENSVLFSLATLQQLSGAESSAPSGAPSSSDSSGLIDINKLAGAITNGGSKKSSIDDIMSVGSSSGLNSPLAAPVLMPMALPAAPTAVAPVEIPRQQGTNKTVMFTGAIVATILSVTIVAVVVVLKNNNGDGSTTVAANTPNTNTGALLTPTALPTPLPPPVAVAPVAVAPVLPGSPSVPETHAPAANNPSGPERPRVRPSHGDRVAHANSPSPSPNEPRSTPVNTPTPAGPTARATARPSGGSIEDLLNRIPGGNAPGANTPASRPAAPVPSAPSAPSDPSGGADLPATPSQASVLGAMRGLGASVRTCGNGAGGRVIVTITFASSGRVTSANASGEHAGDAIGSCAAQRVRSAQIQPFRNPTFNVTYPFTLQ